MVATIVIAVATTACSRPTVGVVDDSLIWGSWSGRDTVVQLGSRHALRNRTDRPATLAVVLTGVTG